ncbi:MAG: efflux RND transporter permease subunit [Bacteroidia bacterium]
MNSCLIAFIAPLANCLVCPFHSSLKFPPTTANIFVAYPGASADVLIKFHTLIPLETLINGVQGMRYIATDATSAGEGTIRIIFEPGTDPDQGLW